MEPSAGILLLAAASLPDPNFDHTVVLLCDHEADSGTFGLVLNHKTTVTMQDVLPSVTGWNAPLFRGGPVQLDTIHFLHGGTEVDPEAVEVASGVFWGRDFIAVMEALEAGTLAPSSCRFFVGYSGWSEGQLVGEIEADSWYLTPADSGLVFTDDVKNQWRNAFRTLGPDFSVLTNFPDDCMLN